MSDRLQNNVTELIVHSVTLPRLPNRVFQLHLTVLDCSQIGLEYLPREIGKLTSLRDLSLFGNKLKSLPKEIVELTLNRLVLSRNQITELPNTLSSLKVKSCDLDHNLLEKFPKSFGSNIQVLFVENNPAKLLPSFSNCSVYASSNFCSKYYRKKEVRHPREPGKPEIAAINCCSSWYYTSFQSLE